MALFDKLKEKVNKVVDVDKLSDMANKTIASVKSEVAKAVDPSIREQERLEKEKALKEQQERERLEKEKAQKEQEEREQQERENAIRDFFSSIDVDEELNYIFSVLEKSGASKSNFERGVEHLLSKTEATVTKDVILPTLQKELFNRAFSGDRCAVAKVVASDYFLDSVISGINGLLSLYMRFAMSREKGSVPIALWEEPFIKALYGIAGRVVNYENNGFGHEHYQAMTPDDFISIIENSDVLKSYTDKDPFVADETRNSWSQDLCKAPLDLVQSSRLGSLLDNEEYVDALYYFTHLSLCHKQGNSAENVSLDQIAHAYLEYLKQYYSKIKR